MALSLRSLGAALALAALCPAWGAPGARLVAQEAKAVDVSPYFQPLDYPAPTETRSASGAPGPEYWQQRADYRIEATLDTARTLISGTETITYYNRSPDALDHLWLQMDQNRYRPGAVGSYVYPSQTRFGGRSFEGGYTIRKLTVDGKDVGSQVRGTRMRVDLEQALPAGSKTRIEIAYSFPVPVHGSDRMGHRGNLYEIAQWYPRMEVYDDVSGWNTLPYLGQGEFYLEYGDFDVQLTVPAGFLVAATGTLQNPGDVLTEEERARLDRASGSGEVVAVVDSTEVGTAASRPTSDGTLTWHFTASNVRDFSWAASPDFRWDATSDGGILCQAFYQPDASPAWRDAAESTCFAIRHFSDRWFPYPYPQATSAAGLAAGMEYPMIVFVGDQGSGPGVFQTLNHELGHQWFPMIVGSNERLFMWQDEGVNTFIDGFNLNERFNGFSAWARFRAEYMAGFARGLMQPPMTRSDEIDPRALGGVAYRGPAYFLHMLREDVVGPEAFDEAFKEYIRRWAYKHPRPVDFFRTMEDVTGEDLDWFFHEWFYSVERLDQAVTSVSQREANGTYRTVIHIVSRTPVVMPVDLRIFLDDGSARNVHLPVQIWFHGLKYDYPTELDHRVVGVVVDPESHYPDVNRVNNSWGQVPTAK